MSQRTESRRQRAGADTILARIASDPEFRQQLMATPGEALAALGHGDDALEVVGYGCQGTCRWSCGPTCVTTRRTK
jgi:hypothetical protein